MSRKIAKYQDIRDQMKPGDIIAFSGKEGEFFSDVIKWATRAAVSHVGIVLHSKLVIDNKAVGDYYNQIIESTTLNGFSGVTISRLSDRVASYDGEMWWLPLSDAARQKLDLNKFYEFLFRQDRKPYDLSGAIKSGLDKMDKMFGSLTYNIENFSAFFCSELAAAGLEAGEVIKSLNASEVTPIDLCMFKIYQPDYSQLIGGDKDIRGYNTLDPEGWGEG